MAVSTSRTCSMHSFVVMRSTLKCMNECGLLLNIGIFWPMELAVNGLYTDRFLVKVLSHATQLPQ